jgi:GNAT superfamily N-acetyltransferase
LTEQLDAVEWGALAALYRAASMGDKSAEHLAGVFGNSMFRVFAFEAGRLVGAGRVLADGWDCAYLCDVAVTPDQQGLGTGTKIIERLLQLSSGHRKIILYAAPGKEAFYRRFGFGRMTTAMAIFADQASARGRGLLE